MARVGERAIPVPEPTLTPDALVARAEALQPLLREQQDETERRGHFSEEIQQEFVKAGFYRCLQPRRFGGYEFPVETFYRVAQALARGCPSSAWCLVLAAGHTLMLGSYFSEEGQAAGFGPDGDFRAPSIAAPTGTATRVDDGWRISGTWSYCSGAPYANWFLPNMLVQDGDGPPHFGIGCIPREEWTMLDDWGDVILGLRGSGSNTIVVEDAVVPEHLVAHVDMVDPAVEGGTPGSRLHGNAMYGGRSLMFFHGELVSLMIGTARAAIDEYEHLMRTRPTIFPPPEPRLTHHDFHRPLGLAMGMVEAATFVTLQAARTLAEHCRRNVTGEEPFTLEKDLLGFATIEHAGRLAWEAVELLFRTAGSSAARHGQRMQRYYRDLSMYRGHLSAQYDTVAQVLARVHLGLQERMAPRE